MRNRSFANCLFHLKITVTFSIYVDRHKEQEMCKLPVSPENDCNISHFYNSQGDPKCEKQELCKLPVSPEDNCKTSYLDSAQGNPEGKEQERCKLTVPPDIILVLDHKQELWEPTVQDNPGSNCNLSPVLGKERKQEELANNIINLPSITGTPERDN